MTDLDKKKDQNNEQVDEDLQPKLKYPRAIPFIVVNEFCERFNYYGMRTILALYLVRRLEYSEDASTVIFHLFSTFVYFFCIFGGIIADSWWGKFKTILILSVVYSIGSGFITTGAVEPWNMPQKTFTFLGLALIALGSGGIKPCVSAFGGDQFKMPEQAKQLAWFFSLFYFSINFGSFISTLITPILREVSCFGEDTCYSLGFFVPAVLMVISIVIFIVGKPLYKMKPLSGNMLVKVSTCIWAGISGSMKNKKTDPKDHWLDHAEDRFGRRLVDEIKILLNVLVLYLPLPIFWTLFDQQGSRWTFQATRMNGDLGFYEIKPDQAQVINPVLILVFIPLYEVLFYPALNLIGIRRPLQKLALGGILAGVAFFISFFLEMQINKTSAVLPTNTQAHLRIYNLEACDLQLRVNGSDSTLLRSLEVYENKDFVLDKNSQKDISFSVSSGCSSASGTLRLQTEKSNSYFLSGGTYTFFEDSPVKDNEGNAKIRILANFNLVQNVRLRDSKGVIKYDRASTNNSQTSVTNTKYDVLVGNTRIGNEIDLKVGGVYTINMLQSPNSYTFKLYELTPANGVNMLWIIPQYVVMTLGEVMYSITGLEFSFTQAPQSMKSVLTGCWYLTIAFGNLIIVFIAEAKFFNNQMWEFLMFAILMWVDMALFGVLAVRYKPIPIKSDDDYENERILEEEENIKKMERESEHL